MEYFYFLTLFNIFTMKMDKNRGENLTKLATLPMNTVISLSFSLFFPSLSLYLSISLSHAHHIFASTTPVKIPLLRRPTTSPCQIQKSIICLILSRFGGLHMPRVPITLLIPLNTPSHCVPLAALPRIKL